MGRWIKIKDEKGYVLASSVPHPLILCTRYLPKNIRSEFHMLDRLELDSDSWTDEQQILNVEELKRLLFEFKRLRKVVQFHEFIDGLNNESFYSFWRDGEEKSEFENHLNTLESLMELGISKNLNIRIEL